MRKKKMSIDDLHSSISCFEKMTTKKELIEFLESLPDDVEIFVSKEVDDGYNTVTKRVLLDVDPPDGNVFNVDLTR